MFHCNRILPENSTSVPKQVLDVGCLQTLSFRVSSQLKPVICLADWVLFLSVFFVRLPLFPAEHSFHEISKPETQSQFTQKPSREELTGLCPRWLDRCRWSRERSKKPSLSMSGLKALNVETQETPLWGPQSTEADEGSDLVLYYVVWERYRRTFLLRVSTATDASLRKLSASNSAWV